MFKILFVSETLKDISYTKRDGASQECWQIEYIFVNIKGVKQEFLSYNDKAKAEQIRAGLYNYWKGV
jgi:uncharacterized lipoprotein YehR (DUF1307 family)